MLQLPIPAKGGKDFLDGNGHFEFHTDKNAWDKILDGTSPFAKSADPVADVSVRLADPGSKFSFGRAGATSLGLTGDASFRHQLQILWPLQDDEAIRQAGLAIAPGNIYARIVMNAQAILGADAGFPVGPLSATVGIKAGGAAHYERWILRQDTTPGLTILKDLYSGLRLPQSVDEEANLLDTGELLVLRYGGYLQLAAGLTWGYSLSGTKSLDVNKLELDLDYKARAMAAVSVGYRIAGEHQIEARRGSDPTWVRFVVRKSRNSETTLAADFGFTAEVALRGLPDSADEFLSKVLGTHADRILDIFNAARKYSSLDELRKAVGPLITSVVAKYANQELRVVLSDGTVQDVIKKMKQVAMVYANLDPRILALYHDVVKKVPGTGKIVDAIDIVLGTSTKEELAALSGTNEFPVVIDLLRRLYNDKLFDVLQKADFFAQAIALLKQIKAFLNGSLDSEIKSWIDMVQSEIPVDGFLRQLANLNADQIRALADDKLKGFVEQLVGKAFHELQNSDFAAVASIVHNNLEKINSFREKLYKIIQQEATQSFQANLHVGYTRARLNEKLLDVEINLAHADGPRLAHAASAGDFGDVLQTYNTKIVRVQQGAFTSQLKDSMNVKINVLGYASEGIVTLVQDTEHTIAPQNGGLLHVYASKTYVERKKTSGWKFKEEVQSKFLVQALADSFQAQGAKFQEYAAAVVRSMSADYDLRHKDDETKQAEMVQYLLLAEQLGLLQSDPAHYVSELVQACDGNLGRVRVTYKVRFDPAVLRAAFHFSGAKGDPNGGTLGGLARQAMRFFLQHRFASSKVTDWFPRIAFAYSSDQAYQWYRAGKLTSTLRGVTLPSWFTGAGPQEVGLTTEMVALVDRMFRYEDKVVQALLGMDAQVDAITAGNQVDFQKLNDAIRLMTTAAKDVGEYDASCFPVILDYLVQTGGGGAQRSSMALVEVTPSKGRLAGQKITRMLTIGPKNAAEVAEDDVAVAVGVVSSF